MSRPIIDEVDARILPGLSNWYRAETMRSWFGQDQNVTHALDESGNGFNMSSAQDAVNKPPDMNLAGITVGNKNYASFVFDGSNSEELRGSCIYTGTSIKYLFALVKQTASGNWSAGASNAGFFGGLTAGDAAIGGTNGALTIASNGGTEYVNGVATDTVSDAGVWNLVYVELTIKDTFGSIVMGRNRSTTDYFSGEIAECGAGTGTPSAAQRTAFFNAMIAKYNITV